MSSLQLCLFHLISPYLFLNQGLFENHNELFVLLLQKPVMYPLTYTPAAVFFLNYVFFSYLTDDFKLPHPDPTFSLFFSSIWNHCNVITVTLLQNEAINWSNCGIAFCNLFCTHKDIFLTYPRSLFHLPTFILPVYDFTVYIHCVSAEKYVCRSTTMKVLSKSL